MPEPHRRQEPVRDALEASEAQSRFELVSDVTYALSLAIDKERPEYDGRVVIRFACARPGTGTFLDFTGKAVTSLKLNGEPLDPSVRSAHRIQLPGERLGPVNEVEVAWTNDYDRTGVGFHRFQDPEDGEVYLFTDFEPFNAHRLFPCFDQPDLKAVFDVDVEAPEGWTVIANGEEIERQTVAAGRTRRRFAPLPRFSTYLLALVAGPYVSVHDDAGPVRLGLHCRRSLRPYLDPDELFEVTRQGFRFYERIFGCPYAFGRKYDQVFVPEFNSGAMENVAAVTFNEMHVFRDPPTEAQRLLRAEVVLHELAHMWFGDLVTMKWWDDLWLNESFATYISFLALDQATRFQDCWQSFLGTIKAWAYREDQKPTTHPIAGTVADTEQTFLNFDGITYGKGASVLKQLRAVLGPDAFERGLKRYFARHAFGNTTLHDFLAALGEAAGRDLGEWSRIWLRTSGLNTIAPERLPDGRWQLLQSPGGGDRLLRPHWLEVALLADEGGKITVGERAEVELDGERADLPFSPRAGAPAIVFCNLGDHAYARVFLDSGSLELVRTRLADVADPLVRMGLWATLWEMARDAVLPVRDFLALVRIHLVRESSIELADSVIKQATTALLRYCAPELQGVESRRLVECAEEARHLHPRDSDLQRLWARAAIGFVADRAMAEHVATWLSASPPLDFEVDQGMRWRIVTRAAAFALPDHEELARSELRRDPSDRGHKAHFAAMVARPDLAAKSEAFTSFVEPKDASADLLKQGMAAFWWAHQERLLHPFARTYFEVLPRVLETQDLEYVARGFVRVFFPHAVADDDILTAARELLATSAAKQPLLRRFLLEETDELERTLALRRASRATDGE